MPEPVRSYTSPKHFGTRDVANVLDGCVVVQEKVDGSQMRVLLEEDGQLRVFSRGGERPLEDMIRNYDGTIEKETSPE